MSEFKKIGYSLLVGLLVTVVFANTVGAYSDTVQGGIAEGIIRLHVLANSDSPEDQALKLAVRDYIVGKYSGVLSAGESKLETMESLSALLPEIERCATEKISELGYSYGVNATLSKSYFPTKNYGGVSFPAGEYDALRLEIGSGNGKNWWCVLFPPLCFVDVTHKAVDAETRKKLEQTLGEEEYNIIAGAQPGGEVSYKVKFKLVEIWQQLMHGWK